LGERPGIAGSGFHQCSLSLSGERAGERGTRSGLVD
jgi:hypothetical protein